MFHLKLEVVFVLCWRIKMVNLVLREPCNCIWKPRQNPVHCLCLTIFALLRLFWKYPFLPWWVAHTCSIQSFWWYTLAPVWFCHVFLWWSWMLGPPWRVSHSNEWISLVLPENVWNGLALWFFSSCSWGARSLLWIIGKVEFFLMACGIGEFLMKPLVEEDGWL